jgi:hypothetical protein
MTICFERGTMKFTINLSTPVLLSFLTLAVASVPMA